MGPQLALIGNPPSSDDEAIRRHARASKMFGLELSRARRARDLDHPEVLQSMRATAVKWGKDPDYLIRQGEREAVLAAVASVAQSMRMAKRDVRNLLGIKLDPLEPLPPPVATEDLRLIKDPGGHWRLMNPPEEQHPYGPDWASCEQCGADIETWGGKPPHLCDACDWYIRHGWKGWKKNPLSFTGPSITFMPFNPFQKVSVDLLGVGLAYNGNGKKKNPYNPSLKEQVKQAVDNWDPRLAGQVVDWLRVKGLNYEQAYEMFNRITGISRTRFEDLMYEADDYGENPACHNPISFSEFYESESGEHSPRPPRTTPEQRERALEKARKVSASRLVVVNEAFLHLLDLLSRTRPSQAQLARELGISKQHLTNILKGRRPHVSRAIYERAVALANAYAAANPRVIPELARLMNPNRRRRRNRDSKWKKPPKEYEIPMEEAKKIPYFADALKKFRRFHGTDPGTVRVMQIPDGNKKTRRLEKVYVALGLRKQTPYIVPSKEEGGWKSSKADTYWYHDHPEGLEPTMILDPQTGVVSDVGGSYLVDDWFFS